MLVPFVLLPPSLDPASEIDRNVCPADWAVPPSAPAIVLDDDDRVGGRGHDDDDGKIGELERGADLWRADVLLLLREGAGVGRRGG